ncbi:hypothetical protein R1sor_014812 [Riccia sorocarpa]|uniref:Uncharacterized protein n=1 Tax=Riccia sorocarpa TaxID=122646 RepID=A0ABD3HAF8_9MARC
MLSFSCSDPLKWSEALASYEKALQSLDNPKLCSLDEWYREELPCLIRGREPPYLSQAELKILMEWKLTRGKWRPGLMKFVSALSEKDVEEASRKAFAAIPDLKRAITDLTVLKGVGPATASAVLAVYAPDVAPFMSDEAMMAALGNAKDYTLKQYLVLAEKLLTKAKELTGYQEDALSESEKLDWSPTNVERAIWASSVQLKDSNDAAKTGSSTGKLGSESKKRLRNGKAKK